MFTFEQYQQLHTAARLLNAKGLLTELSPPTLFCYLRLLASSETHFEPKRLAKELHWSETRTRRCLKALASIESNETRCPLLQVISTKRPTSGQFTKKHYQLVFQPTHQPDAAVSRPKTTTPVQPPTDNPSTDAVPLCVKNKKNTHTKGGLQREDTETAKPTHGPSPEEGPQRIREQLGRVCLSDETISKTMNKYPLEKIARQLCWLPHRDARNPISALMASIRDDWSEPQALRDAKAHAQRTAQSANETQEKLAEIKALDTQQKQHQERLKTLEKRLSPQERDALCRQAERQIRQRLGNSWPTHKPIPDTFIKAEYHRLISARFLDERGPPDEAN